MTATLKKISWFMILFALVLLVNAPILHYDMMYFEQPLMYLVNQQVTSWTALLQIYLHPKVFAVISIPFFRPSGHFLLYQILTPLLGWHNTRGFLVVSFFFLTLTGLMMVRLYARLFPRYMIGGYIAFAFFLMHPAPMLSRLSPMHFEFANMFFILLTLDCFVWFCQSPVLKQGLLLQTLLFYFVAITFKETALMLGPVLVCYLLLAWKQGAREKYQVLVVLTTFSIIMGVYLSMQWPQFLPPTHTAPILQSIPVVFNKLIKILFCLPFNIIPHAASYVNQNILWELLAFPAISRAWLWIFLSLAIVSGFMKLNTYRKPFLFLLSAAGLFLMLPVLWSHAMPWHLGLTLVFCSMLMGFGFEHVLRIYLVDTQWVNWVGVVCAGLIGLTTVLVTAENIQLIQHEKRGFALLLDRNAVLHPPAIQNQLNTDSVVVVADSTVHNDYLLGDSTYPYVWLGQYDLMRKEKISASFEYPYVYGGTLFRWAYLKPNLKEQLYPFAVDKMGEIPDNEVIYNWLQHFNNIFCLGYDNAGVWHDQTAEFKANLLLEQARRHLLVNAYQYKPASILAGKQLFAVKTPLPDSGICRMICDKHKNCKGFTYENVTATAISATLCKFYEKFSLVKTSLSNASAFIKESV
jgi:hypothetical protein